MTNNQLTEAEITETLDAATSGYPLTASAEANLRRVFAELQERRKDNSEPLVPVVDADDNFYSWFGREWHENYQHNQYTTAAKQMLGVMAESAWKAGHRAAMLQAEPVTTANKLGNYPVIPDTWIPVSERMPEDEQEVKDVKAN